MIRSLHDDECREKEENVMYSQQTNTCTRKKVEEKKSITVRTTNNNHNFSHSYLHMIEKRKKERENKTQYQTLFLTTCLIQ
jgi:hypothetical protein